MNAGPYFRRLVDDTLDEVFPSVAAIAIEGPKAVGKTATGLARAQTVIQFDQAEQRELFDADPERLVRAIPPVLLDEWQRHPSVWDVVRRMVDRNSAGGRFLLAGSATPHQQVVHSGAGRIVRLRLRPLSIVERNLGFPTTVSLSALLQGQRHEIVGRSPLDLADYVEEILASGFPGIRPLDFRARAVQLDGYIARIADVDFVEQGRRAPRPAALRAWFAAYAAATATTASYAKILDAATPGENDKPSKVTADSYRETLTKLWLLDPLPGWIPLNNALGRLAQAPKHHLADPALAARLLGASKSSLLEGRNIPAVLSDQGTLLGALFESLVAQSVRVYADHCWAQTHHLRTRNGDKEIDMIVEGEDRKVVAFETKLSPSVSDADVKHLRWLGGVLGDRLADAAVITTGKEAYRRTDGIAVIPLALLGP